MKKKLREANRDAEGNFALEPYCGQCSIELYSGKTYCGCGYTYEERRDSKWQLNGEKK